MSESGPKDEDEADYRAYLASLPKDEEGKIIQEYDLSAKKAAQKELRIGEMSGYQAFGTEADRETRLASYPDGELFETKLTEDELRQAIAELGDAKMVLTGYLTAEPVVPGFDHPATATLSEIEAYTSGFPMGAYKNLEDALANIEKHNVGDAESTINETLAELEDVINTYSRALERKKKKRAKEGPE